MDFGTAIAGWQTVDGMLSYDEFGTVTATVSAETEYAVYVEFGTVHMEAQPYLRPAVTQTLRELPAIAHDTDGPDELVNEIARRIADRMRDKVPVDTGQLKRSITVEEA